MKRALVTGGTGFVGANLVRRLCQDGHQVHLLVRPGYQPWRLAGLEADIRLQMAALEDPEAVARVVEAVQPDWVFHLAAYGAYPEQTDVHQMLQTNVIGTANLALACVRAGGVAFVQAGSSSEYGLKDHAPAETEWLEPNSDYAVTKAAAAQFCRHTAQSQRAHLVTLRLYSVYGPWEAPTRLIPTLIRCGRQGAWPPLVNPLIARDFVYVADVCEAFVRAAQQPDQVGSVYNVGTGVQTPLRAVVDLARRVLPIAAAPQWGTMPERRWDTATWVADNHLIAARLGWTPTYTLEHGFRETLEWSQKWAQGWPVNSAGSDQ